MSESVVNNVRETSWHVHKRAETQPVLHVKLRPAVNSVTPLRQEQGWCSAGGHKCVQKGAYTSSYGDITQTWQETSFPLCPACNLTKPAAVMSALQFSNILRIEGCVLDSWVRPNSHRCTLLLSFHFFDYLADWMLIDYNLFLYIGSFLQTLRLIIKVHRVLL